MPDSFYDSQEWRDFRDRIRSRDSHRCTVARLLGGRCSGVLHVHHIEPRSERPDLELDEDNCATVCAAHHPVWESLRRFLQRCRRELPPCTHHHPYKSGREACDRRRARDLGIELVA
jgi:5-methylcytosine-specific restriction endonuclease McrA